MASLAACKSAEGFGKTSTVWAVGAKAEAEAEAGGIGWLILSGVSEGKLEKNPQSSHGGQSKDRSFTWLPLLPLLLSLPLPVSGLR